MTCDRRRTTRASSVRGVGAYGRTRRGALSHASSCVRQPLSERPFQPAHWSISYRIREFWSEVNHHKVFQRNKLKTSWLHVREFVVRYSEVSKVTNFRTLAKSLFGRFGQGRRANLPDACRAMLCEVDARDDYLSRGVEKFENSKSSIWTATEGMFSVYISKPY